MRYSFEFKMKCVELYRQGIWAETPEKVMKSSFRLMASLILFFFSSGSLSKRSVGILFSSSFFHGPSKTARFIYRPYVTKLK